MSRRFRALVELPGLDLCQCRNPADKGKASYGLQPQGLASNYRKRLPAISRCSIRFWYSRALMKLGENNDHTKESNSSTYIIRNW